MRTTIKYRLHTNGTQTVDTTIVDTLNPVTVADAQRQVAGVREFVEPRDVFILGLWLTDHPMNRDRK